MTLKPGANQIELVASDLVGNVGVEKLEILLDQEPPQLDRQCARRERDRRRPCDHRSRSRRAMPRA